MFRSRVRCVMARGWEKKKREFLCVSFFSKIPNMMRRLPKYSRSLIPTWYDIGNVLSGVNKKEAKGRRRNLEPATHVRTLERSWLGF